MKCHKIKWMKLLKNNNKVFIIFIDFFITLIKFKFKILIEFIFYYYKKKIINFFILK